MKSKVLLKRMVIVGMISASIAFVLVFNGGFGSLGLSHASLNSPFNNKIQTISIIYGVLFIFGIISLPVGFIVCFTGKAKLLKFEKQDAEEVAFLA